MDDLLIKQRRSEPKEGLRKAGQGHSESKNWATFIFTVTLANVGRFFKFFLCQNEKEMAHNKNEIFPTVA